MAGLVKHLQLIQFNEQFVCSIEKVPQSPAAPALIKEHIVTEYKDVFDGLGKLPGQYYIDIDTNVKAVQNKSCCVTRKTK